MSGLIAVGFFIFSLAFSAITFILWARIILRYFRVSVLHPIGSAVERLTSPFINPIAKLLHTSNTRKSRYDWAAFTALGLVEFVKFVLIGFLFFHTFLPWFLVVLYTLADLVVTPCNLLFYAIIIRVIMSWINPMLHNPIISLIYLITEPVLAYARRITPIMAGLDFSPFVVLIVLKIITLFISTVLPFHLI